MRRRTFVVLALAIAGVAPWLGWWPLLFLIPAGSVWSVADKLMPRMARPEFLMFAAWIGGEITIAGRGLARGRRKRVGGSRGSRFP